MIIWGSNTNTINQFKLCYSCEALKNFGTPSLINCSQVSIGPHLI